jgi:hypothetical protein
MAATQWLSIGMGLLLTAFLVLAFLQDEKVGPWGRDQNAHVGAGALDSRGGR